MNTWGTKIMPKAVCFNFYIWKRDILPAILGTQDKTKQSNWLDFLCAFLTLS